MPRKIIQFKIMQPGDYNTYIAALCDDGTLWFYNYGRAEWHQSTPLPQPSPEPAHE